jgi:energy-coupling factor transporter ATP-binding protein EcfA2
MIKRIQIKNFKCYGDPGVDFSLKRINFIFGDNSAGKSTFLQLLRMVLNNEGQGIDDNFRSLVFKGDESKEIKMRITARSDRELVDKCPIYDYSKVRDKKGAFEYKGLWSIEDKNIQKNQSSENDRKCSESQHVWLPHVIHQEAARPVRMGVGIDKTQSSLAQKEVELLSSGTVEYVNRFFKALNVPYTAIDKGRLRDDVFGVVASTENVGAGIDGLYETALKLYEWRNYKAEAPKGCVEDPGCALLALEEPESHVNERQISPLMDFIFKDAKDVVNGQVVIECHSELISLKLKNFLRAGLIAPDELSVFFATKTESGTVIEEIPMDAKGNFKKKLPGGGFFTERTKIVDEFFRAKASK